MIETENCKFCGSPNFIHVLTLEDNYYIVKCTNCDLARTEPEPAMNYNENSDYIDSYLNNEVLFRSFFKPLVKLIKDFRKTGKVLDIGCSAGFFLDEALACGFDVEGIELNKKAAAYCINKGFKVNNCLLHECFFNDELFDIVVMSHVLEHIADLNGFLKEVYRIMAPSGLLVLSQPSFRSLITAILKEKWYGWVPKDHVWHFTPKTISMVLEQNSFNVKDIKMNTMHYPLSTNLKKMVKALIARASGKMGMGDQFYVIAQK